MKLIRRTLRSARAWALLMSVAALVLMWAKPAAALDCTPCSIGQCYNFQSHFCVQVGSYMCVPGPVGTPGYKLICVDGGGVCPTWSNNGLCT
jgi:hypothetical protein